VGRSQRADRGKVRQVSYRLEIRPDVLADIEEAAGWYEDREPGLGSEFTHEVLQAIDTLSSNPLIYRVRHRRRQVRWLLMDRFPYRIIYRLNGDLITIFAVLHSARHDRNWKNRLSESQ